MKKYEVRQDNIKDCGVACLASIIKYYKGYVSKEKLIEMTKTDKTGTSAYHMKKALMYLGFSCKVVKCDIKNITKIDINVPCIAHVIMDNTYTHYIVIYKIDIKKKIITVMDPSSGYKKYSFEEFYQIWSNILILFYPIKKIPRILNQNTILKFYKNLIYSYKKQIIVIIILSLLFTLFNIASSFYFQYIIDNADIVSLNNFYKVSTVFLIIIIIKIITDFSRNRLLIYVNQKIDITLFLDSINHIISLPYSYYKNRTTGEIVSRIGDLSYIREMISRVSITLFVDLVLVIFSLIFLFNLNNSLFLISIIVLFLYILVVIIFNKVLQKYVKLNIEEQTEVTSYMIESLNAFETVKGLHIENEIKSKLKCKYDNFITNNLKFNRIYNFQNILKDTIGIIGSFAILFFGSLLVFNNQMTLGALITYDVLFLYFIDPIRNVIDLEQMIRQAYIAIKRIFELYEVNPEKFENSNEIIKGNITFNNLNFSYNDYDYILKDFNLNIKEKEKLLIVGESGSGKSTLVKLLLGYYKTNKNQLVINEKDINDYDLGTLRNNISYVSQNEFLFTDTVYNNLCLNRKINDEDINKVSKIFLVDEIIKNNPLGYNLLLEENGFNISGGERQRIILARSLLKSSSILVLDESTNQIDLLKERTIFENMFNNYKDKTIIVISHRKENSDLFDRIITMKKEGE